MLHNWHSDRIRDQLNKYSRFLFLDSTSSLRINNIRPGSLGPRDLVVSKNLDSVGLERFCVHVDVEQHGRDNPIFQPRDIEEVYKVILFVNLKKLG